MALIAECCYAVCRYAQSRKQAHYAELFYQCLDLHELCHQPTLSCGATIQCKRSILLYFYYITQNPICVAQKVSKNLKKKLLKLGLEA